MELQKLRDQVIVITGAPSGVGLVTARTIEQDHAVAEAGAAYQVYAGLADTTYLIDAGWRVALLQHMGALQRCVRGRKVFQAGWSRHGFRRR